MNHPGEAMGPSQAAAQPADVEVALQQQHDGRQQASDLSLRPQPAAADSSASPFRSFWMGGFESATHINGKGRRLDMIALTQHDAQIEADYAMLAPVGIRTVRDAVRWHLIEKRPYQYDFSSLRPMLDAAHQADVQVIWNLCHYGIPSGLDPFTVEFVERFVAFCSATARYVADHTPPIDQPQIYVPVNEISFLSWAVDLPGFMEFSVIGRGYELKRQLVRATIAASEAIWAVDPRARIAVTEPLIHVVPPRGRPDLAAAATAQHEAQFETWDMLCGRREPELGGHPRYLDLIGCNYYHSNQFEHPDIRLRWEDVPLDDRWVPLPLLLTALHVRYRRPLFMAETSHFGVGRGAWLVEIAAQIQQARQIGLPLLGVCLYPIIDRPDWENLDHWHNSGLWDLVPQPDGTLRRVINEPYAIALRAAQHLVGQL